MYRKIIIAMGLDHGFSSMALDLARKLIVQDGEIIAVHVIEPVKSIARLYLAEEDIEKAQKATMEEVAKRLNREYDVESVILTGHAGKEIPDYAEKTGADCIVVGAHKPGLDDFFLGSTAARVVRHAKCSVHVLRQA